MSENSLKQTFYPYNAHWQLVAKIHQKVVGNQPKQTLLSS